MLVALTLVAAFGAGDAGACSQAAPNQSQADRNWWAAHG